MESAEIARRWLRFFEERGHTVVPSASLIADDPTLLLVNAGMVPFKPFFLGEQAPPYPRATSIQKCVRTLDIDEVGKTTRHASFFQMCGNFSFGDYFKEQAIPMAWELLTRSQSEGGFGFPEDRLWVTVLHEDDESADLWQKTVGVSPERIQRRGPKDNYWHMGVPGPGGPCSEIYFDRGPEHGREGGPEADEERYLEVWNLVFMQYELSSVRSKVDFDVRGELPARNVDTGMGLERMATLLQGVDNLYEIDTTWQVLDRAAELAGKKYGSDTRTDVALRVVADHARTAVMLIGDGVAPGNEGRGYVLRRMMRRTIRNMRLLGAPETSMAELVDASIGAMAPQYPELERDRQRITQLAVAEEGSFNATLRSGTARFESAAVETKGSGAGVLPGHEAFRLHDTYGFPIDLTLEMAEEEGLTVDTEGFRRLMQEQRERARADAKAKKTGHGDVSVYREVADRIGRAVTFTGYDEVVGEGVVRGVLRDGVSVRSADEGDVVEIVLDRTPFYAEGGGQLADAGYLQLANGAQVEVYDVQQPVPGVIVHRGKVMAGEALVDIAAQSTVDIERRRAISRAHTATHMVHKAIREALGETATQAGSENAPGRFRFDFSAAGAVPPSVLRDVEQRVNALLAEDLPVSAEVMTQSEAVASGAMALFGEKYGDAVRVVSVGDWARELCGGTHAQRSGQLGLVTLLGESSIGAGVRRIEALVGADAYDFLSREHVLLAQVSEIVKARPEEAPERISALVERLRDAEKELEKIRSAAVLQAAGSLAASPTEVFGVSVVTSRAPDGTGADDLRKLVLDVRSRLGDDRPAVVAVAAVNAGRPVVVVAVNARGREWRLKAGALVRVAAQVLGGNGGGKDDVAQGGGTDASKVAEALAALEHTVGATVTG
ncbi:alanyl-tRNA synthetase [Motilibacter peucedani]|uniref:Alanine--tRNA ligase n=1 Tax=Motilibacter peucedani TaxID=598650 RepID=A0A420XS93_9ACTN|nr:alanine--tRNA ligase [Motilibacter peucedani]RKS77746.1 alanyl-tRNA synthetase [Motilibacter peucedani]